MKAWVRLGLDIIRRLRRFIQAGEEEWGRSLGTGFGFLESVRHVRPVRLVRPPLQVRTPSNLSYLPTFLPSYSPQLPPSFFRAAARGGLTYNLKFIILIVILILILIDHFVSSFWVLVTGC